jgi:hypothetical protein
MNKKERVIDEQMMVWFSRESSYDLSSMSCRINKQRL